MSKKRLYIEASALANDKMSGVGNVVLETLKALDNSIYAEEFEIYYFLPFNERKYSEKYQFNNIKYKSILMPHKLFSLFSRLAVSPPIDLFLGNGVYIFPNYRNFNLAFSSSITYFHDVCFMKYPEFVEPRNLRFLQKYSKLWLRRTDKVITVSESSKAEIESSFHDLSLEIDVVPNAVNSNMFYPRGVEEVASVRDKYQLSHSYYLFLGNIEPRKNILTLIKAFIEKGDKNTTLFIVGGDGWLNTDIESAIKAAQAEGYDIRRNETYVPDEDIPLIMTGALAVVMSSWHEGYGLPIIQGLACGTATIGPEIPSIQEIKRSLPGSAPLDLFSPDDVAGLTDLLNKYQLKTTWVPKDIPQWSDSAIKLIQIVKEYV